MKFYLYKDPSGEWRWYLKDDDSRTIAESAGTYPDREACMSAVDLVMKSGDAYLVIPDPELDLKEPHWKSIRLPDDPRLRDYYLSIKPMGRRPDQEGSATSAQDIELPDLDESEEFGGPHGSGDPI